MHLNTRVSAVAVIGGLAWAIACSSDSSGPGPLPSCGAHGSQLSLAVAAYSFIDPATDSGCVTFAANASTTDTAEYLVLPQSAGGTPGSSAPFSLQSASPLPSITVPSMASLRAGTHGATAVAFDHFLREMGRNRRYTRLGRSAPAAGSAGPTPSPTAGPPAFGGARTFKVCANLSCSTLTNVGATVRAVGAHIAIYVDTLAPAAGLDSAQYDSLKQVFDSRLYPLDTTAFGGVSDIDSNTVVIVLMTGAVNKLVTRSRCNSSGYIAGFFFPGDLDPGFAVQYNNGEVFYSVVADPDSTLSCAHTTAEIQSVMPVTFTHEFQHMISFVEHVLVRRANSEEGWLDEGLSKYAEEIAGRSFLPGDPASFSRYAIGAVFDAYQYLQSTGSSPLLIPADTGTLAEVGASWLFTRYIVDRFGDSLPRRLVHSSLTGSANVAAQTGQPFDLTVSRWGLANWVSDLPGFTALSELQYIRWHFRTTFASLHTQDPPDFPRPYPMVPPVVAGDAVNLTGTLWSGSGVYLRAVQPPGGAAFTLHFTGSGGGPVSAAIVPRLNVIRIRWSCLAGRRCDRRRCVVDDLGRVAVAVGGRGGRRRAEHQVGGGGAVRQNPQGVAQLVCGHTPHAGRDLRGREARPNA